MAKGEGGGLRIGSFRIGCGWIVLALAGAGWLLWRTQPAPVRAAGAWIASAGGAALRRARPTPTPAASPSPSPEPEAAPSPEPEPTPSPEPEATPAPEPPEDETRSASQTPAAPETTDLSVGTGPVAEMGKTVLARIDGQAPVAIMLGAGDAPAAIEAGVLGMRAGGRRRIAVPGPGRRASFPPDAEPPLAASGGDARVVELKAVW